MLATSLLSGASSRVAPLSQTMPTDAVVPCRQPATRPSLEMPVAMLAVLDSSSVSWSGVVQTTARDSHVAGSIVTPAISPRSLMSSVSQPPTVPRSAIEYPLGAAQGSAAVSAARAEPTAAITEWGRPSSELTGSAHAAAPTAHRSKPPASWMRLTSTSLLTPPDVAAPSRSGRTLAPPGRQSARLASDRLPRARLARQGVGDLHDVLGGDAELFHHDAP